jgi:hypothetical protein
MNKYHVILPYKYYQEVLKQIQKITRKKKSINTAEAAAVNNKSVAHACPSGGAIYQ